MTVLYRRGLSWSLFILLLTNISSVFASDLAAYQWTARPLLIFAQSQDDAGLLEQKRRLKDQRAALQDRDMIVAVIDPHNVVIEFGASQDLSATKLRQRFGIADADFAVILVGKDGGSKARSDKPVAPEEIYQLIDAMPMRQREMRDGNKN